MKIELKKFGNILNSRPAGKDAYSGFLSELSKVAESEIVEVDFAEVVSFAPSWGDEFLSPLLEKFGDRLKLTNTRNSSVVLTLKFLEEINGCKFSNY
jgi:hypothetical protein